MKSGKERFWRAAWRGAGAFCKKCALSEGRKAAKGDGRTLIKHNTCRERKSIRQFKQLGEGEEKQSSLRGRRELENSAVVFMGQQKTPAQYEERKCRESQVNT